MQVFLSKYIDYQVIVNFKLNIIFIGFLNLLNCQITETCLTKFLENNADYHRQSFEFKLVMNLLNYEIIENMSGYASREQCQLSRATIRI